MKRLGLLLVLSFFCIKGFTQPFIRYQGVLRDASSEPYLLQGFKLKITIISDSITGSIAWEETHDLVTSGLNGRFVVLVGNGTTTGSGTYANFGDIEWAQHNYFISLEVDIGSVGTYEPYGTVSLFSVPYTFYSLSAGSPGYKLNGLTDVDTSGLVNGQVLKWNGSNWVNANDDDSDTVNYAVNSTNALIADTAEYVMDYPIDSVLFSQHGGTSNTSNSTLFADSSNHAVNSDTAGYVFFSTPFTWVENGNTLSTAASVLGTNDPFSFSLRTNNSTRFFVDASGKISNGGSPLSGFHWNSDELFIHSAPGVGSGSVGINGSGTRFSFIPFNGSIRMGTALSTEWDSLNLGEYSMAIGENVLAGSYSFTIGKNNTASGDNAMVFGRACSGTALGTVGNGTSFCVGDSSQATGVRTVVMGRQCHSANTTAISIGYKATALANVSTAIGSNVKTTTGLYSMIIGSWANGSNRQGCFVYGDASTTSFITPTANHQMLIRASGGIELYSDPTLSAGVMLLPGSGSWSMVSDRNKKQNFSSAEYERILTGISKLKINSWNYRSQSKNIRHIGPTAQQFKKEFGVGESKRAISMIDMDGVILAGARGIYLRQQNFIQALDETGIIESELKADFNGLEERIKKLEKELNK